MLLNTCSLQVEYVWCLLNAFGLYLLLLQSSPNNLFSMHGGSQLLISRSPTATHYLTEETTEQVATKNK